MTMASKYEIGKLEILNISAYSVKLPVRVFGYVTWSKRK